MHPHRRDLFLKIEPLAGYSPLAPVACARRYGRDCMFNEGHELGRLTPGEIFDATLDALVYREYLDPHYAVPNTAKLVPADANEPPWNRRIPGAVLYARPGERLYIHVLNGDPNDCHSFHLHGLRYGIESDGAWPFGVMARDGRRSDEIRPGEQWTYVFDATEETIGAWAFHDHAHNVQRNVNLGLFGGLIVRDPRRPCPDHDVPLFIHQLQSAVQGYSFRSKDLQKNDTYVIKPEDGILSHPGTVNYYCAIHGTSMSGRIDVLPQDATPPQPHTININNLSFGPPITIRVGDTVTWVNQDDVEHVVFSPGGGKATYCLNGRAYVGNTPTIVGTSGERVRWYTFNLDLSPNWHNFHPHSVRWQLPTPPGGAGDVHALSPVESFVTDTEVPPAMRLPCPLEELQCDPPAGACLVQLKGDFLFHCHVEEHMMQGLAGLVRARQRVWITHDILDKLPIALPFDDGADECAHVDMGRCTGRKPTPPHDDTQHAHDDMPGMNMAGSAMPGMPNALDMSKAATEGMWELLPCDSQVLAVHAAVLRTGKVLFISGSGNNLNNHGVLHRAVVWDYQNGGFKTLLTPTDVFCCGHAFMGDGRLLVAGGTRSYASFPGETSAYLFDPQTEDFTRAADMADGRWYPSLVTLASGEVIAVSGWSVKGDPFMNDVPEVYSQATNWTAWTHKPHFPLYPHLFLLRDGRLFYSGGHVFGTQNTKPGWLHLGTQSFTPMASGIPATFDLDHRDQSASVLLPPAQDQKVMLMGGGDPGIRSVHRIDLSAGTPAYTKVADMHFDRIHLNAVLLPDRTVFVSGGEQQSEKAASAAKRAEIYHPTSNTWTLAAEASVPRMYHSVALLLPDGRVITAGSNPEANNVAGGELRLELYHPPYLFKGPRPYILHAPEHAHYGDTIEVETPQAHDIKWVNLIRPMATTHSWDSNQRLVDVPFRTEDSCHLRCAIPREATILPQGWYMLFLTDRHGIPSAAAWINIGAPHVPMPAIKLGRIQAAADVHLDHEPPPPDKGRP